MKEYLKAQIYTDQAIADGLFGNDELDRFSKSDCRWAENRKKNFQTRTIKKGEIYQIEFGKNFAPEMSYEHRGLIIGGKSKLYYVLPIFSYNPQKHVDVFHPTDNPLSKSDFYLLKASEYNFISHDSVLKLNDIRSISINRILYSQFGRIPVESETFSLIERLVIQKVFPSFLHKFDELRSENEELRNQIEELKTQDFMDTKM